MTSFLEDLRISVRSLLHRPLFTAVAMITLALGIGANAAIFSVIDAVVLSPLRFAEPDRLLRIYSTYEGRLCCTVSAPNFVDMREQATRFEDLAAYAHAAFSVTGGGEPERLSGYQVSAGTFELMGVEPQIGRFFARTDDVFGAEPVVVIAESLWKERYGGDAGVLGTTLTIDGVPRSVIGVAPAGFRISGRPQLFVPFAWDPAAMPGRGNNALFVIGRVASGSTVEAAMDELSSIYARLVELYPDNIVNKGVDQLPLEEWLVGSGRKAQLLVLWGAVGMVLLVACANVMNLMLARAEARQQELAIRSALGASRARLVRHFVTESLLVALAGGAAGAAAAYAGLRALLSAYGGAVPRSDEVALSGSVLLFTLLVSAATGLVVGVVPALRSSVGGARGRLQEGGRGSAGGQSRLRRALVVLEVAIALVLVVGAGLMLKSLWRLSRVDVGVRADRILSLRVSLPEGRYPDRTDIVDFFTRLRDAVARLPMVEQVGLTNAAPFSGTWINYSTVSPVGRPEIQASFVEARDADAGYFEALELGFVQGRSFDGSEGPDTPPVVVVNEELARQLFAGEVAIGRQIGPGPGATPWEIVGVVENLREHGPDRPVPPTVYFSAAQGMPSTLTLVARTTGDPLAAVPAIRTLTAELDPELPLYQVSRLDQLIRDGMGDRRFTMSLLGLFAGVALALGAVGIYGVMAYTVEQRTREIGLRQALGASPRTVLRLIVRQGATLALTGVALGLLVAYLLRKTLAGFLYEVGGFDAATYVAVAALLTAVALLACLLPARRAAAVTPMEALRER